MAQSGKSLVRERLKTALKELERGRPAAARKSLEQALAVDPGNAEAHAYLGTALLQLGELGAAIARLERAAAGLVDAAWVMGNLAEAYFRADRHADAERGFLAASRLDPANLNHRIGVANCMAMQGRHDEAASALEALLRTNPAHPLLWFNLGNVRREQQRPEDAARCFTLALDAAPEWLDARNSLGSVLHGQLRFADAEREYRACIAADPDREQFRINLASLLIDDGRPAEAEDACRSLIARAPDSSVIHTLLSAALTQQGKLVEALEHDRAAARLSPDDPQCAENHAVTLAQLGRFDAAWPEFERAVALQANASPTRYARALQLLACGRFAEGWREYAHRIDAAGFGVRFPAHRRSVAIPDEASLRAGAKITLLSEQGLGDELFFLRFARLLSDRGASVRYRSGGKLHALLRHAEPVATVMSDDELDAETPVMLIGDLPHALFEAGMLADDAPPSLTYPAPLRLHADAERLAAMRRRLLASGPAPYIGVTWTGGVPPKDQGREWTLHKIVDVERLGRALRGLPGTLICVQRNPVAAEAQRLAEAAGCTVHDYSALNDALEDMQALLALLDEYVGVSNTNMHMRAGAGKSARVLVTAPAEWRWPGNGSTSPWFPGFTCYRQGLAGDWEPALRALEDDLRSALSA